MSNLEENKEINNNLEIIKDKIDSINSVINYQKEEILKTECLILRLQLCLLDQNDALSTFNDEKKIMEDEQSNLLKLIDSSMEGALNDEKSTESVNDVEIINIITKERSEESNGLKRKNDYLYDDLSDKERKEMRWEDDSNGTSHSLSDNSSEFEDKISLIRMNLPELGLRQVYTFYFKCGSDVIFLGGSDGLLLKYGINNNELFETNSGKDIVHIESVKNNGVICLIVFTKNALLIYDSKSYSPFKGIGLKGICNVFNDGNSIFITLRDGSLMKLSKTSWMITDVSNSFSFQGKVFFSSTLRSPFSLITLKDNLLYKAPKNNFNHVILVKGPYNVKAVIREGTRIICYSSEHIWCLSQDYKVDDLIFFENGVKFVENDSSGVVVGDWNNIIHVYSFTIDNSLSKIFDKKIESNVTSVGIKGELVYVACEDGVFITKNTSRPSFRLQSID